MKMKENTPSNPGLKPAGFVIPIRPTFDKIAALWLALKITGRTLSDIDLISRSSSDPKDSFLLEKRSNGYYLIDVGPNKYQTRGTGSAVETVCRDFNITDPVLMSLVVIANRNNQTGYLKSYKPKVDPEQGEKWEFTAPNQNRLGAQLSGGKAVRNTATMNWSVVWLLRDAYKIGWDLYEILAHVFKALDAWEIAQYDPFFDPGNISVWKLFGSPALDTLPLFSVPTLVYQLSVIGKTNDEIEQEIIFWTKVQRAVMQAKINAQEWAIKFCEPEHLYKLEEEGYLFEPTNCPGDKGVFVDGATEMQVRALFGESDDSAENQLMVAIFGKQAIAQKFGLIINHARSGNYAILPSGLSLDFVWVYNRLRGLERQIRKETPQTETLVWHLDVKGAPKRQRHQLLNGSQGWPLPASKIFPKSVIRFVRESAYFMGKRPAGEKK